MPSRTKFDKSDEMIAERRQGTGKMPDDMPKWMASTITNIDKSSKWIGNVVCWKYHINNKQEMVIFSSYRSLAK